MTTITKDDLHNMWAAEQLQKQEKTIALYVNAISADIIAHNEIGNKTYKKVLYKETDQVKTQVVQRLQSVFIDSNIIYSETDQSITVDWSSD
jgi:hypothetical protein